MMDGSEFTSVMDVLCYLDHLQNPEVISSFHVSEVSILRLAISENVRWERVQSEFKIRKKYCSIYTGGTTPS